jgi:menaquinol-cytochrome c reductase cytochrome b/c subunit
VSSLEERRRRHAAYKRHVARHGKPFFPYAMFHDTVMSLVVVAVIIGLAVIWHETADGTEAGILGPLYAEKADPATTSFIPRPDWYFYFLFYLLRIFKWPDTVILGTVGIPTIAMILLFALPFVDRRLERRLAQRPVAVVAAVLVVISMGTLTWKGATVRESLPSEALLLVPQWMEQNRLPASARPGAELFAQSGCQNCHTYLGSGTANLGAPDLSAEGRRNRGLKWQIEHLRNPARLSPGSPMPSFAQLGEENLRKIAIFLEASKGPQP